ncbi:vacuolar atp synthase subunit [Stylonychia lemnae]|uniref:Vacuolar atp synthase subunit n=1 Tax=Stylonychia lemnae TaxID=5949 RepID=A0A078A8W2_STYLE|nr:vacuolar atp synthase subunit [Stylonychia lemnae]|eukprot:CDW78316.1 vacuolar atp synthase subunit [Stylonychia lemnae]
MEGSVKNLLDAEKESQQIIEQAVKDKAKKVTEARLYAEQEINKLRKEYEERFQVQAQQKQLENLELTQYDEKAQKDIELIKQDFETNKRQVIKMLLDQILVVDLAVPKVVQQKFD